MLSIRFDETHEWWVSGLTLDRLFQAALDSGRMSPDLDQWRHVADANGGLDLSAVEGTQAAELASVLRSAAELELDRLKGDGAANEDGSYRIALLRLLDATT